ncbi:hypothetical protein BG006_005399, partial [Podila minutissima]
MMLDLYGSVNFGDSELSVEELLGHSDEEEEEARSNTESYREELLPSTGTEGEGQYHGLMEWFLEGHWEQWPQARTPEPLGQGLITVQKLQESLNEA